MGLCVADGAILPVAVVFDRGFCAPKWRCCPAPAVTVAAIRTPSAPPTGHSRGPHTPQPGPGRDRRPPRVGLAALHLPRAPRIARRPRRPGRRGRQYPPCWLSSAAPSASLRHRELTRRPALLALRCPRSTAVQRKIPWGTGTSRSLSSVWPATPCVGDHLALHPPRGRRYPRVGSAAMHPPGVSSRPPGAGASTRPERGAPTDALAVGLAAILLRSPYAPSATGPTT
jgi:hypothetical protein